MKLSETRDALEAMNTITALVFRRNTLAEMSGLIRARADSDVPVQIVVTDDDEWAERSVEIHNGGFAFLVRAIDQELLDVEAELVALGVEIDQVPNSPSLAAGSAQAESPATGESVSPATSNSEAA